MQSYAIYVPRNTPWESRRAHQFIEQMLFAQDSYILRIAADQRRIVWEIVDYRKGDPKTIENTIVASYPDAHVQLDNGMMFRSHRMPVYRYLIKYQYFSPNFVAPILGVEDIREPDPLAAVVQAMSQLKAGERIIFTLIVDGIAFSAYKEGRKLITRNVYDGSLLGLFFPNQVDRYVSELQSVMELKLQKRLYQCFLTIQVETPELERLPTLLVVDNQIINFQREEFNGLSYVPEPIEDNVTLIDTDELDLNASAIGLYREFLKGKEIPPATKKLRDTMRLVLSAEEIAALWHLPHTGFKAATIGWARRKDVRLPQAIVGKQKGIRLGVNCYRGHEEPIHMPTADRLTHLAVVGKTGVGKSNLLHHLIHQDIASWRGVAVIDPHGQLVQEILRTSIPNERVKDVVVIDLANESYPAPLNPLAGTTGQDFALGVGRLMTILDKRGSFKDTQHVAPNLRDALLTLEGETTPTLRDVSRLFADEDYRYKRRSQLDNPTVEDFWTSFVFKSAAQQEQISTPILSRLRDFYNRYSYPLLCHPDELNFAELIRQRKIILVSLVVEEGKLSSLDQQLLGSILVSQLEIAVMSGAAKQHPFYLYIDEVQHFVTTSLAQMLSEARKSNLALTVANQYLKQLAGDTLEAIVGNIGGLVVFQCGHEDARPLASYMKPAFDAEDLINLDKYTAAVFMRSGQDTLPAFTLYPDAPLTFADAQAREAAEKRAQAIRALSHKLYTPKKSRAEVLAWLKERYSVPVVERSGALTTDATPDEPGNGHVDPAAFLE